MSKPEVLVVGAGLAGLGCAVALVDAGRSVLVLEAAAQPGGRVRTDLVDGFRIDRGFQVLNTAYPEVARTLDLDALEPRAFRAGALVRRGGRFHALSDPRRHVSAVAGACFPSVGTLRDRWRLACMRGWLKRRVAEGGGEESSLDALRAAGFSGELIEAFLRPFLAGVFLDRELRAPVRQLAFVWEMFERGRAVLPARGMQAIPDQMAARLPPGALRCGEPVASVESGLVRLASGALLRADEIVVATEASTTARLLGRPEYERDWRSVTCLSFDAPASPVDGPWLVLGGAEGPINNLCVPSDVAFEYAPPGRALVSVSVIGEPCGGDDAALEAAVRSQLLDWYGEAARAWRTLRIERIRRALPVVRAEPTGAPRTPRLPPGLHVAGDHLELPSIQHALASGRQAAREVLERTAAAGLAGSAATPSIA